MEIGNFIVILTVILALLGSSNSAPSADFRPMKIIEKELSDSPQQVDYNSMTNLELCYNYGKDIDCRDIKEDDDIVVFSKRNRIWYLVREYKTKEIQNEINDLKNGEAFLKQTNGNESIIIYRFHYWDKSDAKGGGGYWIPIIPFALAVIAA